MQVALCPKQSYVVEFSVTFSFSIEQKTLPLENVRDRGSRGKRERDGEGGRRREKTNEQTDDKKNKQKNLDTM